MNKNDVFIKNDILIRNEKESDYFVVENLVRESFWNIYRPGSFEHYVLHLLRNSEGFLPKLSFVMEKNGVIIGQNVFFKAKINLDNGNILDIATMGPICIANEYKRKGYGKILLDYSLIKAKEFGIGAICFEGDINFYGKSGFVFASKYGIRYHGLKEGEDDSFFLCKELKRGYLNNIKGEYETPSIYMVNEKDVDEFDKKFPYKQKLKLPSQIF